MVSPECHGAILMARDRWGYGPADLINTSRPSRSGYVCSLTLPIEAYSRYQGDLKRHAGRVYEHLPQSNGTQRIRLYCHSARLDRFLLALKIENIPYDFVDEQGISQSFRCFPDGFYGPFREIPGYVHDEALNWKNQWKIHQQLKVIRLIKPE